MSIDKWAGETCTLSTLVLMALTQHFNYLSQTDYRSPGFASPVINNHRQISLAKEFFSLVRIATAKICISNCAKNVLFCVPAQWFTTRCWIGNLYRWIVKCQLENVQNENGIMRSFLSSASFRPSSLLIMYHQVDSRLDSFFSKFSDTSFLLSRSHLMIWFNV